MNRTKTVFTEREIAHVWANRGATSGHSPLSSFMHGGKGRRQSFAGDQFLSYSTTIGRRIRHKGRVAYVLDAESFGPTTGKHLSAVRGALKDSDKVFTVYEGRRGQSLSFTPQTLRDHYLTAYREQPVVSRYKHVNARALLARLSNLDNAIDVCRFFGLPHKILDRELDKVFEGRRDAARLIAHYDADREAKCNVRWAKRSEERAVRDAARVSDAIKQAEEAIAAGELPSNSTEGFYSGPSVFGYDDRYLLDRPDLLAGIKDLRAKRDAATIQDWLEGKPANPKADWPTLLRAEYDGKDGAARISNALLGYAEGAGEMVTTRGARVPLSDAKRAFGFLSAVRRSGQQDRLNLPFKVGMYQIDSVSDLGIVAGCHRITWAEIERFAGVMGWTGAQS